MNRFRNLLCASFAVLLLLGSVAGAVETKADPAPESKEPAAVQKAAPSPETVLAVVEGTEIKMKDVQDILGRLDPQRAAMYDNEPGHRAVLEELVNMELFYRYGQEQKVSANPEFERNLESLKKDLTRKFAIDNLLAGVTVTEEEVAAYYEKNKDKFEVPGSVRASHILVSDDVEMKKVQEDLKGGMSFEDAAKKYSTCPSKEQGGDLGFFSKGQMVPEFETAAFAMKAGETTPEPVKTQFGLHLIKVTEKKEASVRPLAEVKDELREGLLNEKKAKLYQDQLTKLREQYKVEIVGEEIKKEESKAPASGDAGAAGTPEKK